MAVIGTLVLASVMAYAGGSWYFSSVIGERLEATARLKAWDDHNYGLAVEALDGTNAGAGAQLITLRLSGSSPEAATEGVWGVRAPDGGFGQIGRITAGGAGQVTREFHQLMGPPIRVGENLQLVSDSFPEDPQAALGSRMRTPATRDL